jgi:hypothetical protein
MRVLFTGTMEKGRWTAIQPELLWIESRMLTREDEAWPDTARKERFGDWS